MVGRDLVKTYRGSGVATTALSGVTLEIPSGVLACVTGPSGCGKTTLLHVLSGLAEPDRGEITVAGRQLQGLGDAERADLRRELMGFVFQRYNLLPALTVAENVALPLLLSSTKGAEVRRRVGEVVERVGLAGRERSFPAALSGGEAQRVAIARALSMRPRLIWADEPTGALDSVNAGQVMDLFRELADDGATIVVATHDQAVATRSDLEIRLRDGRREDP